jgi:hypothetical protein
MGKAAVAIRGSWRDARVIDHMTYEASTEISSEPVEVCSSEVMFF